MRIGVGYMSNIKKSFIITIFIIFITIIFMLTATGVYLNIQALKYKNKVYPNIYLSHKKIDGYDQIQADIFHYLDTLEKKPGAVKSSKALKSKAELKAIYDKYFTNRTKDFIVLLRKNAEKSYEELQEILIEYGTNGLVYESDPIDTIENHVHQQTSRQISKLSSLFFSGGSNYVN